MIEVIPASVRWKKLCERTIHVYTSGKSDEEIVVTKPMNKDENKTSAELVERRASAERNSCSKAGNETPSSTPPVPWRTRIRLAAKGDATLRFNNLLHHITPDLLKEAFYALKRNAAKGIDEVTWYDYLNEIEGNLQDLHDRIHKMTFRATPSRRVWIPKADGRQRPLAVPALEDKIVQQALVWVLECIYEVDFKGFSYGFRPKRGCHRALDALSVAISQKKVSWILDADIKGFFDAVDHRWMIKFLEHRIQDQRILRLIKKFLKVGVMEDGKRIKAEGGTPQGAVLSPLLANVYLHYALDLWVDNWRKTRARGEVYIVRYADDFVIAFQYRDDANTLRHELSQRLTKFSLELHPDKTRLIEFGRFAISNARERNRSKPETFDFLGFTHYCWETPKGTTTVRRKTIAKRMRAKLKDLRMEIKRRRHLPVEDVGKWLGQVMNGHLNYFSVPGNKRACNLFRTEICRAWFWALRSRSHKAKKMNWQRFTSLVRRWIPSVRVKHPYPSQRLIV